MNTATIKKRRHSGPTIRVSEETYEKMGPLLFTKDSSRQIAISLKVNGKTVYIWRKCANAALNELGSQLQFPSALTHYRMLFIKKGPVEISKELKISKEAVKGLEIILRSKGLLKGSRIDQIKAELHKWGIKDKKRIMNEYGLGKTAAEKILKGKR